jgi:hypothetical protein
MGRDLPNLNKAMHFEVFFLWAVACMESNILPQHV